MLCGGLFCHLYISIHEYKYAHCFWTSNSSFYKSAKVYHNILFAWFTYKFCRLNILPYLNFLKKGRRKKKRKNKSGRLLFNMIFKLLVFLLITQLHLRFLSEPILNLISRGAVYTGEGTYSPGYLSYWILQVGCWWL
jgi:hypothetical protein